MSPTYRTCWNTGLKSTNFLLEINPLSYSLSDVVETLDILWMLSEEESGLENVECKQTNQ